MPIDSRGTIGWLIAIRAMVATLLLGWATVAQVTSPDSIDAHPFFWLIAATFGLTLLYTASVRWADRYRWVIDVQLACDVAVISGFVYLTGGVTSFFSSLYALPIIAAGLLQFRRGAMLAAAFSA